MTGDSTPHTWYSGGIALEDEQGTSGTLPYSYFLVQVCVCQLHIAGASQIDVDPTRERDL